MDKKEQTIQAGDFKQRCLAILDQVAAEHRSVVITKRGKPVARLVPLEDDRAAEQRILASLRAGEGGMLVEEAAFLAPSSELVDWPDP